MISPPANDWTDPREQKQELELEVEVEGEVVTAACHDPPSYDAAVEGGGNPSEPPPTSSIPLAATPKQPVAAVVALPPATPADESVRESVAAAKAAALPFLPGDMHAFEKATQSEDSARVSMVVSMAMQWYTEHDARIQAASSVAELAAIAAAIKTDVRHQLLLANHVDRLREAWREKDSEVRAKPQAEPTEDDAAAIPGTNGGTPPPTDAALKEAPAMAGSLRNELAAGTSHCTPDTDNAECKTAQGSFARRPICGWYTAWFSSLPACCFAFISHPLLVARAAVPGKLPGRPPPPVSSGLQKRQPPPRPALPRAQTPLLPERGRDGTALPAKGRLMVVSTSGAYIVDAARGSVKARSHKMKGLFKSQLMLRRGSAFLGTVCEDGHLRILDVPELSLVADIPLRLPRGLR